MANPTASSIIVLIRNLLRADSGSDVPVISDSFLLTAISDGNGKYSQEFNSDGNEPLVFQREYGVTLISEGSLAVASVTNDTSLTLSNSASFPSTGSGVVWTSNMPDIFTFTSNAANVFGGVTGLGFAHSIADAIQPLYALPSNFGSFREAPSYGNGVRMNGQAMTFIGGPPEPGTFTMYDDGTTKYLWLPRQVTGFASVLYDKASSIISTVDDTVDVPTEFQFYLVWHALALCYMGREKDVNLMLAAQVQEDKEIQRCLQARNTNKKIRPRNFGRFPRDYTTLRGQVVSL